MGGGDVYCVQPDLSQWVRASLQNVVFLECCQTVVDISCSNMVVMVVSGSCDGHHCHYSSAII